MKPGRELDALVAERVIGWRNLKWHEACHEGGTITPKGWYGDGPSGECYLTKEYSENIAAAFAVDKPSWLWEFQETPGTLTVELHTSFALRRKAIEMFPILPEEAILVRRKWLDDKAQTYAWLRCLAALEAVGVICVPEGESITLGNRAMLENVIVTGESDG